MAFWKDFIAKHNLTEESDVTPEDVKEYLNEEFGRKVEDEQEDPNKELNENLKNLTKTVKELEEANRELAVMGEATPPETFEDALFAVVGYNKEEK